MAEVRSTVTGSLKATIAKQTIAEQGALLLASVEAGESVEAVAKANALDWQVGLMVKRNGGGVNPEILNTVFQMQSPADAAVTEGFYMRNGDYVVASLIKVMQGDVAKLSRQQKVSLTYATSSINGSREIQAYQSSLVSDADIKQ